MELPEACTEILGGYLKPELFKALSDPHRLALLANLAVTPQPMTVSEASSCCDVHFSGVSRHLSILKQAGIVTAQKNGRQVSYQLNAKTLTDLLRGLANAIDECCAANDCCTPNEGETHD